MKYLNPVKYEKEEFLDISTNIEKSKLFESDNWVKQQDFIVKAQGKGNFNITGYASVYNIADYHNDIVQKGAFNEIDLEEVKFLWQHNPLKPIGIINEVYEDDYGLKIKATVNANISCGKEAIELIKQNAINVLSVGINIVSSKYSNSNKRIIIKADLIEISLVTFPANSLAKVYRIINQEKEMNTQIEDKNYAAKLIKLEEKVNNFFARPETDYVCRSEEKSYFEDYLKKGIEHNLTKKSLSSNEGEGGVLLLPALYEKIIKDIEENSPIRQLSSVQVISSNALDLIIEEGKFNTGWVGENEERKETDNSKLVKKRIVVHELYAQPKATQKLIDDSAIQIETWLIERLKESFASAENEAFLKGDGNNKPKGILSYEQDIVSTITIKRENIIEGLLNMINSLKEEYFYNATFVMNRKTLSEIQKLKDNIGRFIWQQNLTDSLVQTILGIPVVCCSEMPQIEDRKTSIILGDFKSAYKIVDRKDIDILRDPYTSKPFVKFYAVKRVGGDLINPKALIFGNFDNDA